MSTRSSKRPYRPKIKGCHECSQRRISCDRMRPRCQKCTSRDLQCSGIQEQYRFATGMASRGKWKGRTIESAYEEQVRSIRQQQTPSDDHSSERETYDSGQGSSELSEFGLSHFNYPLGDLAKIEAVVGSFDLSGLPQDVETCSSLPREIPESLEECQQFNLFCNSKTLDSPESEKRATSREPTSIQILDTGICSDKYNFLLLEPSDLVKCLHHQTTLEIVPSWKRSLLLHYSNSIASEMVAIDGWHNGWRYMLLPIAHLDDLVMNAILTASAFHLTPREDGFLIPDTPTRFCFDRSSTSQSTIAESLYERTILGLQQRRDLPATSNESNTFILLAIMVLLSAVQVKGGDEFPTLYSMMQAVVDVVGGEDQLNRSDLGKFIVRQIRKFRIYASPYISEQVGRRTLALQHNWTQIFECLQFCSENEPAHAPTTCHIAHLVHQAHDIYLSQACQTPSELESVTDLEESIARVEGFRQSLEAFPENAPGRQALTWAIFVAASGCYLEEHKAFFETTLQQLYMRNGFYNIMRGLDYLRNIWREREPGIRWTTLMPQARLFLA